ncbi:hypothetical protein [Flavobacterium pectinovorum]|uniref:hypothetical protein n=1 Tax=Flavobacterium pectinovorum TaxID=29533 RepID=UPI001FAC956D|nr:hypothetical protein [Flavobacterium pectinovorum]MCI9844944.1 hypothetical protein [Flavobacterium pectinovorum]
MKKYACLLLFALLLNGCDDGDLTPETIDFDDPSIKIEYCTNTYELLYKLKSQESLLLQMPKDILKNQATADDAPQTFAINTSTHRLFYRTYDGTVAKANICDAIRPSSPNITDEWYALGGTIVIHTKPKYDVNVTENSTRIVGYTHSISFKNLSYSKPAGVQVGPNFVFGDIDTDFDDLDLTFGDEKVETCTSATNGKIVYNFNDLTSLTINNIDPDLIANEVTPLGTPRTRLISATQNKVIYNVYNGLIPTDYFCKTPVPATPAITQTWTGLDGVAGESGIIEVTTTSVGPNVFKHIIVLKNVILDNGNVNFKLGRSFLLGELQTESN